MKLTDRAYLACSMSLNTVSEEELTSIRIRHAGYTLTSSAYAIIAIAAAGFVGFAIPSVAFGTEWPTAGQQHTLATHDMLIHLGFTALASCWAAKKMIPKVGHHLRMIVNPKTETIRCLHKTLQTILANTFQMLIMLASVAVPAYLAGKAVFWLLTV